uniref:Mitochondrial translational initiation factor 3 n=1 Tax=Pelusios castaneus TaxID=367368 RepID=A0A8C8SL23_9SAUR
MAAFCIMKLMHQTTRNETSCISRYFGIPLVQAMQMTTFSQSLTVIAAAKRRLTFLPTKLFCTTEEAGKQPKGKGGKKNAKRTVESIGRKIPDRILHVIDKNGESLGNMHRADVIQLMEKHDLKLVPLRTNTEPPAYKLMNGKQIHELQLKHREKEKANPKTGPIQLKEITMSVTIAKHDFQITMKKIQEWIEKKHHIRISIKQKNVEDGPEKMLVFFDQIVESMPGKATYLSKPKVINEGRCMCILRHMSNEEIREYKKMKKEKTDMLNKENGNETTESHELH